MQSKVNQFPYLLEDTPTVYCPGCSHGLINRLLAEVIEEINPDKVIGINSQGCGVFLSRYLKVDMLEAPLGQAPAVAAGMKHVQPSSLIFTFQGDGDLMSYGIDNLIHAANRGDKTTVIMINNLVDAQTGGQMSPSSLVGQVTQTSPYGRSVERLGKPLKVTEMISGLDGTSYAARVSTCNSQQIKQAKQALKHAFEFQRAGKGFSIVEFLAICPTYWHKTPLESVKHLEENLIYQFPLGEMKKVF